MTEHEYTFIRATWAGSVTSVNGAGPERHNKIWDLVNSLGADGWRVVHVTSVERRSSGEDTVWVVLHRESHGPELL